MSELIVSTPENITLRRGQRLSVVTSDVYNIAQRVKELDPNLRIVLHEGHEKPWVIVEMGPDGVERFVSRYEELDSRIIDHLRYMLAVPLQQRVEKLAQEVDKSNEELGRLDGERMEKFQYDFHKALLESNMITPKWGRSYRPKKRG